MNKSTPIQRKLVGWDSCGRPIRRSDPYERVMAQTERQGDCLVFTGLRNATGYGRISVGGNRQVLVHRLVWRHHNPDAPEPEAVMHSCDNPPCLEIRHLRSGTRAANSADMVAKGRSPRVRGEQSGMAKLTSIQVEAIRGLWECGLTQIEVAAEYGIHPGHVSRIVTGQRRAYG